jgi:hypothetical protein
MVQTGVEGRLGESASLHCCINVLIPEARTLLKAVDSLIHTGNKFFAGYVLKIFGNWVTVGYLDVDIRFFSHDTIQKSGVDIHLVDSEITTCSNSKKSAYRRIANDRREGLIIVEAFALKISECSAASLEPCEGTILILFNLEDPLETETTNARRALHNSEGAILFQTSDLSLNGFVPVMIVWVGCSSSLAV